ncbi:MAG: DUF559 domain-containing protein [Thermoleophilia bacterium]|nr:DUF559 domain-containing protein [Thermoleophilia bacterium]
MDSSGPSFAAFTRSDDRWSGKNRSGWRPPSQAALTDRQFGAAVAEASRRGYLNVEVVTQILEFGFGMEGSARLRNGLRWWSPETVNVLSVLEGMFQKICHENSIEMPKINRRVCGLKVDFVWPKQKVVVETDGFTFHGDLISFKRDHERLSILARGGYLRLAFTYWQITETPEEVIEAVLVGLTTWSP